MSNITSSICKCLLHIFKLNFLFISKGAVLVLIFFILAPPRLVLGAAKEIPSTIQKVVVFLNGAQVIRTAQINLPAGQTQLVFKSISPLILQESLQVKGEGKFTILSVVHQLDPLLEQNKRTEITQNESKLEIVKDQLAREQSLMQVLKNEETMLTKNQDVLGQNPDLGISDLKEAISYQRQRLTELKLKQLGIEKNIQKLSKTINKLEQQLQSLNAETDISTSEIIVQVSAKEPLNNVRFTISYLVEKASWFPSYDIRVKNVAHPISLFTKAHVSQQCGENWNNVKLILSTGNPALTGVKPQLATWHLDYNTPPAYSEVVPQGNLSLFAAVRGIITTENGQPVPGATVLVKETSTGTTTDINGQYLLRIPTYGKIIQVSFIGYVTTEQPIRSGHMNFTLQPDTRALEEVVVTNHETMGYLQGKVSGVIARAPFKSTQQSSVQGENIPVESKYNQQQTSVSYDIAVPYTVLSDGKNYTVEIKEQAIPALFEYYCAPKLDTDAFLTAKILNWEEYNLLEGEANLFFEDTYMGKTVLNPNLVSDTLELSLGRDKGIIVTRTKLKEQNKKQILGNNRIEKQSYAIQFRNKKTQAVRLIIQDQIPVSSHKEIEVLAEIPKEATFNKNTGKLTWMFDLNPAQEKKVNWQYSVRYPSHKKVILD